MTRDPSLASRDRAAELRFLAVQLDRDCLTDWSALQWLSDEQRHDFWRQYQFASDRGAGMLRGLVFDV